MPGARSYLRIPDDVLLCIFDNLGPDVLIPEGFRLAQATHNGLSLVSEGVFKLVERVRHKELFVPTAERARLLLDHPNQGTLATIRSHLLYIVMGRTVKSPANAVSSDAFGELLAVLGGVGGALKRVWVLGTRLSGAFFWPVKKGDSLFCTVRQFTRLKVRPSSQA